MTRVDNGNSDYFWAVDVPGMTREQAEWLVSALASGPFALHGIAVNPAHFFTVRVDRDGAEVLRDALRQAHSNDIAAGLAEILESWLDLPPTAGPDQIDSA